MVVRATGPTAPSCGSTSTKATPIRVIADPKIEKTSATLTWRRGLRGAGAGWCGRATVGLAGASGGVTEGCAG
jgi:hypothetical protein